MTLRRDAIPSPNYSSRGGSGISTIVLHTAEGATTYQSLGNYFANPAVDVSSHVGIDDTPGVVGEYVLRTGKSWTASSANPYSVQAELCAFAAWSPEEWNAHPVMLENTAAWIAEEAAALGIPIRLLSAAQAQSAGAGVCQHNDLGAMGGGHWDCGPSFPIARVLDMAAGTTPAPPTTEDDEMRLYLIVGDDPRGSGEWFVTDLLSKRYCPSLQNAVDTDYWLANGSLGAGKPLVCNRDARGDVAGPIAARQSWVDSIALVG